MKGVTGEKLYGNEKEWELNVKGSQSWKARKSTSYIDSQEALTTLSTQVYALYIDQTVDILCNLNDKSICLRELFDL